IPYPQSMTAAKLPATTARRNASVTAYSIKDSIRRKFTLFGQCLPNYAPPKGFHRAFSVRLRTSSLRNFLAPCWRSGQRQWPRLQQVREFLREPARVTHLIAAEPRLVVPPRRARCSTEAPVDRTAVAA